MRSFLNDFDYDEIMIVTPIYYNFNPIEIYANDYVKYCELLKIDPLKPLNLELYEQRIQDIKYYLSSRDIEDKTKVLLNLEKASRFFKKRKAHYIELALITAKYLREKRFVISPNTVLNDYVYLDTKDAHLNQLVKYDLYAGIFIVIIFILVFGVIFLFLR
jgi:hypothetical protein